MRNRYLVCYDIANPKRLTKVHKTMQGFGEWLQLSVFACDLSPQRKVEMMAALTAIVNLREDRVMMIDLGPSDVRGAESIEFLGIGPRLKKPPVAVVV